MDARVKGNFGICVVVVVMVVVVGGAGRPVRGQRRLSL
jgi:hypothetical protein